MRVAILSDKLLVSGGAERYLANILRQLLADGGTVDFYTTKVALNDDALLTHTRLRIHRQNLSWCPRRLRHIFFEHYLRREVRREDYDLVLGLATPYAPDIAICFGTFLGSMLASDKLRMFNPLSWVRVAFEAKKYRNARRVLVRSREQKAEIRRLFGVADENISVLPPPIVGFGELSSSEASELSNDANADAVWQRYGLEKNDRHFIFVSNNHHRKGLKTIIRAFDELARDDCRVLVVGAERRGFTDRPYLRWLGRVNDLPALYRLCDAALLPSHYEPFGQVVAEALLSGLPVFVSDRVGAVDVFDETMGRVTACGDSAALANALQEFLAQPFKPPADRLAALREHLSMERHLAELRRL